jgi:general secretion pathway protein L
MAHGILGIDLGAWSVKVAVLQAGFKRTQLMAYHERRLPPPTPRPAGEPEESLASRAGVALEGLLAEQRLESEFTFVALPGDQSVLRLLSFPFADAKQIAQTVSYEFEGQIPYDLGDLVFGHEVLSRNAGGEGTRVLCAGARREAVAGMLADLATHRIDPRGVGIAPLLYEPLTRTTLSGGVAPSQGEPPLQLLVDVGHQRTNVVALENGHHVFARTLSRGGQAVTRAIAAALQIDEAHAEEIKHTQVHVQAADAATGPFNPQVIDRASHAASHEALALARDLRQTLQAIAGQGRTAAEVLLCGGGSLLAGLPALLQHELELPIRPYVPELPMGHGPLTASVASGTVVPPGMVLALGIALSGAAGRPPIDLRQGDLAARSDYSFLRAKASHLATCVLAVLAFMAVDAVGALHELRKEQALLDQRFAQAAQVMFPGRKIDPSQIVAMVQPGGMAKAGPAQVTTGIPEESAAAILEAISKAVPSGDKLTLDVTQLSIQPKTISLRGTTDKAENVDLLKSSIQGAVSCIDSITPDTTISDAPGGGKSFSLSINHHCE